MKSSNKIFIYALIISVVVHSVLILLLLRYSEEHKKQKKLHKYTKPILVEPYKFIKNLEKFKIKNPKYASIKPHYVRKNTRLNAPPSFGSYSPPPAPYTPPATFQRNYAHNYKRRSPDKRYRRVMSNSHIISKTESNSPNHTQRLSNLFPLRKFFNQSAAEKPGSGIKNPSHGIKSATVNLNTTTIKYASYLLHVKDKIENVWEYPYKARRAGLSGLLVIEFSINKNGSLHSVAILRSSGKKILDRAAVKAIYNAARYNPFPNYWKINRLNIVGTFIYRLSGFYVY
jgi:protein TonB